MREDDAGLHAAASYVFLDSPDPRALLEIAPAQLLTGDAPRLLEEWQTAPQLWNLVRRAIDGSPDPGRFILTGSSVPADDLARHTCAGRRMRLHQYTMSWFERGDSSGAVSLRRLFDGAAPPTSLDALPFENLIARLLRPGFPALLNRPSESAAGLLRGYLDEVARVDIGRVAAVRNSPDTIRQLIAALARSTASEVTWTTLAADLRSTAPDIQAPTVRSYVEHLERLFVVDPQVAWTPPLRSRARLRTSSKYHLADPALAAAALGGTSARLIADPATVGLLFESAVIHDLRVYASTIGGTVRHYRDSNGHEIDSVVEIPDGRWGAVEVKTGGGQLAAGASSLARAASQIDTGRVGAPSFRLVVTGTGGTLTLDDGTASCPLTALGP